MAACRWVKTPASKDSDAVYCGEKVSYTMPLDDDQNKYRKYETFCCFHKQLAENEDTADE